MICIVTVIYSITFTVTTKQIKRDLYCVGPGVQSEVYTQYI